MKEVRKAAVEVLDEAGDDGVPLEDAMDEVAERENTSSDQARVNLLIVSSQQHSGGSTTLVLDDEYSAEDFLTQDTTKQETLDDDRDAIEDEAPSTDEPSDFAPSEWSADVFELGDLETMSEAPMPVDESFHHLPKLEAVGHPLVPDSRSFIDQRYRGDVSEQEWFTKIVNDADFGVLLEGEPGTAKGTMVKATAASARIPLVRVNMGVSVNKEKLVGGFVPKENGNEEILSEAKDMAAGDEQLTVGKALELLGAKDQFEWKHGLFTLAFLRGWWILVDEVNAAEAETLMPFFGALEEKGSRSLELTEASLSIEPHPNFRFIATMNPPHHEGTHELNDALKDRCHHMVKSYLPEKKEADLIRSMSDVSISSSDARSIVRLANQVRDAYPKDIDQTLTPRGCKRIAEYTELFSLEEAAKEELLSRSTYEDTRDALERVIEASLGDGDGSASLSNAQAY